MSTQITLRLPDSLVTFLDDVVGQGAATSRAEVVTSALERELRHRLAERDAQILRDQGAGDDLDALVEWSVVHHSAQD
ncbi:YlcI/YnfO family protein [Georgenia sp. Z1491]|uniref:YlcI/YnfO family protein n=1 Tax=Georgenia sp. Z1491 TaxID=3416707 RepID=UPI003CEE2B16